jgi:exodeoxyribonuclease VII large subunit
MKSKPARSAFAGLSDTAGANVPEWTVSDLAGELKRTLEDRFGYVRLKGEVSGYRGPHGSGHVYFCLKDEGARIDAVIWRTAFSRLRFKPQEGLEVIATGRITTYPGKSTYQISVEALEPAGIGALMALLEERRRKLSAEGLFEPARKRNVPYLPAVIGVVTSPTGAVIRDILHRLEDRFPRRVLVWPARMQGDTSAEEVAAGIRGFNALVAGGRVPRPDVLIVARGGGSLEDLWSFNEEIVVRAAAESAIPLVSAVGHETDWTLLDHVADLRAPTPTGAAELVVPVRAELSAEVSDLSRRLEEATARGLQRRRSDLRGVARCVPRPEALFNAARARLEGPGNRLVTVYLQNLRGIDGRLARAAVVLQRQSPLARLAGARASLLGLDRRPGEALRRSVEVKGAKLHGLGQRLHAARSAAGRTEHQRLQRARDRVGADAQRLATGLRRQVERKRARYATLCSVFESLNYKSVLARGFAVVRDGAGHPLRAAADVAPGQALALEFADGSVRATADGGASREAGRRLWPARTEQGTLFDG